MSSLLTVHKNSPDCSSKGSSVAHAVIEEATVFGLESDPGLRKRWAGGPALGWHFPDQPYVVPN
jgi:hypothetical protein